MSFFQSNPVKDARWKAFVGGRVTVKDKGQGKFVLVALLPITHTLSFFFVVLTKVQSVKESKQAFGR
jgi:hypothetical protein